MVRRKGAGLADGSTTSKARGQFGLSGKSRSTATEQTSQKIAFASEDALNYDTLKALAERLGRPVASLLVQDASADPFYADLPMRLLRAQWFKEMWDRLDIQPGAHLRRIHYRLVAEPIQLPRVIRWKDADSGEQLETSIYLNNRNCWIFLGDAATDARYLGLIPIEHIADQRNAETEVNYQPHDSPAATNVIGTWAGRDLDLEIDAQVPEFPEPPQLTITAPAIAQPYAVEVWIEKSTMDDILDPLARRHGANFTSGTGDISLTRCNDLIERSLEHGKPVRVLCVTDFDPGGANMPVALARKLEFIIRSRKLDLDIQVRPVALLPEQVRRFRLPRNAIKESVRQAAEFERKYGAGATELDALEALHPGALRRIVEKEIKRYVDPDLRLKIGAAAAEASGQLQEINAAVAAGHEEQVEQLRAEHEALGEEIEAFAERARDRFAAQFSARIDDLSARTEALFHGMTGLLAEQMPDADDFEWPEPADGDEDGDPLFASTRSYVQQVDRFKLHQQKPILVHRSSGGRWRRR